MTRVIGLTGLLCLLALGACSYHTRETVVPAGSSTTTYSTLPGGIVQERTTTTTQTYP